MVMTFLPGSPAVTPHRDDLRRKENAALLKAYIAAMSSLVRTTPADDAVGNAYCRVVNPALAEGRNLVINGDFATDTIWTKGTGWTIAAGVAHNDGTGASSSLFQSSLPVIAGRIYHITFTISNYVSGSIRALLTGSVSGTAIRSANGVSSEYVLALGGGTTYGLQTSTNFVGDVDDFSITQVGIPASSAFPTTELVKNPGFDWDVAWTKGAGWTISGGVAVATAAAVAAQLTQAISMIAGRSYDITYTISNYSAGSIRVKAGSGAAGTTRSANGTYTETLTCTTTLLVIFDPITSAFTGNIDNVSVVPHDGLVAQDGALELWTSATVPTRWTTFLAGTSTVNQETVDFHSGANACRIDVDSSNSNVFIQQLCLKTGSTYLITFWAKSSVAGKLMATNFAGTSFTLTTSWAQYSFVGVAATAAIAFQRLTSASSSFYIDDVVITELPPMSALPVNGVVLGHTSSQPLIITDISSDGVNDVVNEYSGDFNSAWTPALNTLGVFAEVSGSGAWTDATVRYLVRRRETTNEQAIFKSSTSNRITFRYVAGGTTSDVNITWSALGMHLYAMTVDVANNRMIAYIDGVEVGRVTGLGTWTGNLSSTLTALGASTSTTGANSWSGYLACDFDTNIAEAADTLLLIAELGGVA